MSNGGSLYRSASRHTLAPDPDGTNFLIQTENTRLGTALPPADGGRRAWLFLFAAFMVEGLLYGFLPTFGVFLKYYEGDSKFGTNPFLPVIGTLALVRITFGAPLITPLIIRYPGHRKYMIWYGWLICLFSLMASSYATQLWHLVLSQGLGYGVGFLTLYYPLLNMLDEWWVERRAFAYGILFGSGGIFLLILPISIERLLDRIGRSWTLLAYAGIIFIVVGPILPFLQGRQQAHSHSTVLQDFDTAILSKVSFTAISFSNLFQGLGIYLVPFFIPSYASAIGLSTFQGTMILSVTNVTTMISQVGIGYLADSSDAFIIMFISSLISGLVTLAFWGISKSFVALLSFGILYGIFSGGYNVLYSRFATVLTDDRSTQTWLYSIFEAQRGLMIIVGGIASGTLVEGAPDLTKYGARQYGKLILAIGIFFVISSVGGIGWFFRGRSFPSPRFLWAKSPKPLTYDVQELLSSFKRLVDRDIEQGILQQNDHVHERYLQAFRQTLEADNGASRSADLQPSRGRSRETYVSRGAESPNGSNTSQGIVPPDNTSEHSYRQPEMVVVSNSNIQIRAPTNAAITPVTNINTSETQYLQVNTRLPPHLSGRTSCPPALGSSHSF
ncbi:major facilitator superfamily domain-containing protein [Halenospora varia]|nr:major facilitator superfamily domain-containing protein [Halenospora varia]